MPFDYDDDDYDVQICEKWEGYLFIRDSQVVADWSRISSMPFCVLLQFEDELHYTLNFAQVQLLHHLIYVLISLLRIVGDIDNRGVLGDRRNIAEIIQLSIDRFGSIDEVIKNVNRYRLSNRVDNTTIPIVKPTSRQMRIVFGAFGF